jgi:hypothetical protein
MSTGWFGRALALAAGIHVVAAAQTPSPDRAAVAAGIRADHAVGFYDASRRRVVIVGGAGDPKDGERDQVWSWSGHGWDAESDAGPPGRVNAGAAYAAHLEKAIVAAGSRTTADGGGVLLFGGIPADRSGPWPGDTWALDGEAWVRIATEGPPGRGRTAMAYDARRKQVVLFGGVSAPPGPNQPQTFFDDTWTWDGARWRQTAAKGPRGRYAHGMVFDEQAGVVLVHGGAAAHRNAPLSDMWRWDGTAWTEIPLTGPTPGHRYQPVMVYDAARGRTILHGRIGGASDTWEWNGVQWRQIAS